MEANKEPTYGNGKICYLELPAVDVAQSATFYKNVFDWNIRRRDNGRIAFDDAVGEVSGTWVIGRNPHTEIGLLIYIMVDNMNNAIDLVTKNGGKIVQPVGKDFPEITARFSDPAGNILGLYQQPS
jgi:uncharacterized protein